MKKNWIVQWLASIVGFGGVLTVFYFDGLFGEDAASTTEFWFMISIVLVLVSALSAGYLRQQVKK